MTALVRSLLLPLFLPSFLIFIGQGIFSLTIPFFAQSFGVSFVLITVAIMLTPLGNLVGNLPAGILLSRVMPWKVMILGSTILGLSSIATGLFVSFEALVVLRFISGLGLALAFLSRYTFVAESIPAIHRGRVSAMFGGIMRFGAFLGPLIGGFLAGQIGLPATFHLAGVLSLIGGALMLLIDEPMLRSVRTARRRAAPGLNSFKLFSTRAVLAASGAQILGSLIRSGRLAIVPLFAAVVLELDIATTGLIIGVSTALDMIMFPLSGYLMDRFGRRYNSIPSFALMAVGMLLLASAHNAEMLWAAALVLGIGNGVGAGLMMTLGADLAPVESKSEFLGIWRFIGNTGNAGGPIVIGAVADVVGLHLAAAAIAGFGIAAVLVLATLVPETLVRRVSKHMPQALDID